MSTDRDVNRIVRSWLEEGVTALPDRVLDTVLDQLPATPQRRAVWPARRFGSLNTSIRLGLAAAAVVVAVVVIGAMFWPKSGGIAGPGPSPSPSTAPPPPSPSAQPSPGPSATVQRLGDGPLQAGTVLATGLGQSRTTSVTFTVPEGWTGFDGTCVLPEAGKEGTSTGFCFHRVDAGLYSDPCHGSDGPPDVPVGPTVDELATALGAQKAYTATKPTAVTLGGYSGKLMDLQLPSDVASCDQGAFTPWAGSIYAQGPDHHWRLWILDVGGDRLIVNVTDFPATSEADRAEQQAIVDSMRFEP